MAQLARRHIYGEEAEDVATEAYGSLWRVRKNIRARELGQWYLLVRRTVRSVLRTRARVPSDVPLVDVPDKELPYLQAIVEAAEDREAIYRAADRLWLGEPPRGIDPNVATLAAQMVLLKGMPAEAAAMMVGSEAATVEEWLALPSVRARAAFGSLCWESDSLASHVLRPDRPLSSGELDRVSSGDLAGLGIDRWGVEEAPAVCWHVRNTLNAKEIVRRSEDRLERGVVEAVLRRAVESFPFRRIARRLRDAGVRDELADGRLWRRMAFEYHTGLELPYEQIEARTVPPATEAGYPLAGSTIRSWLGNGRLWAGLASFLEGAS